MTRSIKNLIAAMLIAISGYLAVASIWPSRAVIDYLKVSIEEKNVMIASRSEILEKIAGLRQERDGKYAEFQRLALILPEKDSIPEIITAVESMFSQAGVALPGINLGKPRESGQIGKITLEVGSAGTYSQFVSLLGFLETNLRIFDVTEILMGIDKKEELAQTLSTDPQLTFNITGNFYVLNSEN